MVGPVPFPPLLPLTGETKAKGRLKSESREGEERGGLGGGGLLTGGAESRIRWQAGSNEPPDPRNSHRSGGPTPPPPSLGRNTAAFPPTVAWAAAAAAAAAGSGLAATSFSQPPSAAPTPQRPPPCPWSLDACWCATASRMWPKPSLPADRIEASCPPRATVQSDPRSRPIRARHSGGGVTAKTNQRRE